MNRRWLKNFCKEWKFKYKWWLPKKMIVSDLFKQVADRMSKG